jgi:DNA-directed RNA polymerase subunit RPC12/RpoP
MATKKTKRITCPYCGRKAVALTRATHRLYAHTVPGTRDPCLLRYNQSDQEVQR